MNRHLQVLYVVIFISSFAFGQNQAANWYFGLNAGVNFNTTPATALTDGVILSTEGAAAVSTADGRLLFYTNGRTIWNKNHKAMANGTGLLGNPNTTQSAVIVPRPKSKNIYYTFTLDDLGGADGLSYSEVDMAAEGGLGKVTSNKNTALQSFLTEKLTAIRHGNGVDYWVLVHGNNDKQFFAFKITENGVSKNPITSTIGSIHPNILGTTGYMKFSPNGKKVACAVGGNGNFVEILDFNDRTGKLSNPMKLNFTTSPYGIEFSPDNKRIYISAGNTIYQYTLPIVINSSLLSLSEKKINSDAAVWGLQLGLNKKIYACKQGNKLAVINAPNNTIGSEDFKDNFFVLSNTAVQGLPNQLQNYFNENLIAVENACAGQPATFKVLLNEPDSIIWNFGGTNSISSLTPKYTFTNSGSYTITATVYTGTYSKEITRTIIIENLPSFTLGADTVLCKGQFLSYNFTINNARYLWNNKQTKGYRNISTPGIHYLDVTTKGCTVRDSVNVKYNLITPNFTINTSEQCIANNSFQFTSTTKEAQNIEWFIDDVFHDTKKSTQTSFSKAATHKIKLQVTSSFGCVDSVVKEIKINRSPKAFFTVKANNTCGKNNSYTFTNTTQYTGSISSKFIIEGTKIANTKTVNFTFSEIGEHIVKLIVVTEQGCESIVEKKITVYPAPNANFTITNNSICLNNNSFTIKFNGKLRPFETLTWKIDGTKYTPTSNNFSKSFTSTGKHSISAKIITTSSCVQEIIRELEVYENPTASFITTANTFSCLGKAIEFKNLSTGTLPLTQYDWAFGDNSKSSAQNPKKTYTSQSQFLVTLTTTNEAGCSHTISKNINTYEQPNITLNTKTISACENDNAFEIAFTNTNNAAAIANIVWETSDGTPIPPQNPAPVSFAKQGIYGIYITVKTVFGCEDKASTTVTVSPLPNGTLVANKKAQCLTDNSFTLSAPASHNGIQIDKYKWNVGVATNTITNNTALLNYTAIGDFDISVELTDKKGCKATLYSTLTVHPMPQFEITNAAGCVDVPISINIKNLSPFIVVDTWNWELGNGTSTTNLNTTVSYNATGKYTIKATATSNKGCSHTTVLNNGVEVFSNPKIDFEHKRIIWNFKETVLEFEASTSINTSNFVWDFGNGRTSTNIYQRVDYTDAGYYTVNLKAITDKGCEGMVSKRILIVPPFDAYVPSSFTPNGDGKNDSFGMEGVEFISTFQMRIFNRWGQQIFQSNAVNNQWNGKYNGTAMPPDVYTFIINITDAEGRPYEINGTIQLIR